MKRCSMMLVLFVTAVAWAVKPLTVTHTTQANFVAGKTKNVVVWSLGEVTLGRKVETICKQRKDVGIVSAVVTGRDGSVYAGTATKGLILRVGADGDVATLADLESVMVTDLLIDGDRLLAATAGGAAGVYSIEIKADGSEGAVEKIWSDEDAKCVWGLAMADGTFYAATSPKGKVYAIDETGQGKAIFTAKQKTIRSIAARGGKVLAGAGDKGLVYLIDVTAAEATSRVLLDAAEREIVAVAVDDVGNCYAAATNVTSTVPAAPATKDGGKPVSKPATTTPASDGTAKKVEGSEKSQPAEAGDDPAKKSKKDKPKVSSGSGQPASRPATPARRPQPEASPPAAAQTKPPGRSGRPGGRTPPGAKAGNTVYRIDAEGFVKVVGKQTQTIYDMVLVPGGKILLAAGGGGVHEIDLDTGSSGQIAELDSKRVMALAVGQDGAVAGTAEPATVVAVSGALAEGGTLVSKPIDAKQVARWGSTSVLADLDGGASVSIATRTGNLAEATDETWSSWSAEIPASSSWAALGSPAGRFLQYRLTFKRGSGQSPKGTTAVVDQVQVVGQVGNLEPEVGSVTVALSQRPQGRPKGPAAGGPMPFRVITIKAADRNGDKLRYTVFYRRRSASVWIKAAEDLTAPKYAWDTRTVPDGRYQVKVEASDAANNSPETAMTDARVSRTVVVDNTPPAVVQIAAKVEAELVKLSAACRDANRIARIEYVVDSDTVATVLEAVDGIYDSAAEKAVTTIKNLDAGPHVITVKVVDEYGNAAYTTVDVILGP